MHRVLIQDRDIPVLFFIAMRVRNDSILPDTWMNDIGEKIPNWFENARLYYAYWGRYRCYENYERFY